MATLGQSIWLDYIRRDLITGGELRRLIEDDGLQGMTSNPAIFEKAIVGSQDYDREIQALAQAGRSAQEIYETLSQQDVRSAADVFRPLYDRTEGRDGYVSLEVNPHLARDTQGTLEEARRLWGALDRPNVLIKVPADRRGPAGHHSGSSAKESMSTSPCSSDCRATGRWPRPMWPASKRAWPRGRTCRASPRWPVSS